MRRAIVFPVSTLLAALLLCATSLIALGAVNTWDGGSAADSNWTTIENWNNDTAPANDGTADIHFAGTTRLDPNVDVAFNVHSITYDSGSGTFVNSGQGLTIGVGGVTNNSTNLQTINNNLTLSGAQTFNAATGNLTFGGTIDNGGNLLTVSGAHTTTINGVISGNGGLKMSGTGSLVLAANNTYAGATTIDSGILVVGNGGTTGSLGNTGIVTDNGTLEFNRTDTVTFANNVTGSGLLIQNGTGTLILTGTNDYTGGTIVAQTNGVLQGTTDSLQGDITNFGRVDFIQNTDGEYAGAISGSGGVTIDGAAITFTGNNSITGSTHIAANSTLILGENGSNHGSLGTGGVLIDATGTLSFDRTDNALTISGIIAGDGAVTQDGTGTTTLSGANTYNGGTTVNAGTLRGTTTSLQQGITVNSPGTLSFNQSTSGTFGDRTGDVISGDGDVSIDGTGAVTFSGANTYTGATKVNAGELILTGSIDSSVGNVSVASGATMTLGDTGTVAGAVMNSGTLQGTGTIAGDVTNDGTVIAGSTTAPKGTLTVNNYINNTASNFNVNFDGANSNQVHATGVATLNGGTVNVGTGFQLGTTYKILTADGGLSGTFDGTSTISHFIIADLSYDANDAFLTISAQFNIAAQTQNQLAVANYLNVVAPNATGDLQTVITALEGLTDEQAAVAMEQMAGDSHATLSQIGVQDTTLLVYKIAQRLRAGTFTVGGPMTVADGGKPRSQNAAPIALVGCDDCGNPTCCDCCDDCYAHWGGWALGYGMGGAAKSDGNALGVSYEMGGMAAGVERWVDDCHLLGFYGGYTGVNMRNDITPKASINGGSLGSYFFMNDGFSYYTALVGTEFDLYSTHRLLQFDDIDRIAFNNNSGWQAYTYLERGFSFETCHEVFQPFVGVQYVYLRQNSFIESGADSIDLAAGGTTTNSLRSMVGARIQRAFVSRLGRRTLPEIHAMWLHEYLDSNTALNAHFAPTVGTSFTVNGLDLGRDWALAGAGVTWEMHDGWSLNVSYDCQTNTQSTFHVGSGGVAHSW